MSEQNIRLENVAVILNRTSMSENIGATARAAANMGVGRLIVVAPERFDRKVVEAVATGTAEHVVRDLEIAEDLPAALAEFQYVIGTTARRGSHRGPFFNPREMARQMIEVSQANRIALLFGPERTGLSNEDLWRCHAVVRIPTADPKSSSLNVAQAVLILCYELMLAGKDEQPAPTLTYAPEKALNEMYDHLSRTLVHIGFLPRDNTRHWLQNIKKIFNRSGLTVGECSLFRGICRRMNHALRLRFDPMPEEDDARNDEPNHAVITDEAKQSNELN